MVDIQAHELSLLLRIGLTRSEGLVVSSEERHSEGEALSNLLGFGLIREEPPKYVITPDGGRVYEGALRTYCTMRRT